MTFSPLKQTHKMFVFEPLHLQGFGKLPIAVENFTFSQTFSPTYGSMPAYGRMDPIVTYQNTGRTLSINFDCQAHHVTDGTCGVIDNVKRINRLTQCLYPSYLYSDGYGSVLKSPPFFRVYYGSYIGGFQPSGEIGSNDGLTGYIQGFSHGIGSVPRNVAFGGENPTFRALPRMITVGFTFVVIHDKMTGWESEWSTGDEFSPNGYGVNFPYNVGDTPRSTKSGIRISLPSSVDTTTSISDSTADQTSTDRNNDPTSAANTVANAQASGQLKNKNGASDSGGIPKQGVSHGIVWE